MCERVLNMHCERTICTGRLLSVSSEGRVLRRARRRAKAGRSLV